jgi:hypothetical protein
MSTLALPFEDNDNDHEGAAAKYNSQASTFTPPPINNIIRGDTDTNSAAQPSNQTYGETSTISNGYEIPIFASTITSSNSTMEEAIKE